MGEQLAEEIESEAFSAPNYWHPLAQVAIQLQSKTAISRIISIPRPLPKLGPP